MSGLVFSKKAIVKMLGLLLSFAVMASTIGHVTEYSRIIVYSKYALIALGIFVALLKSSRLYYYKPLAFFFVYLIINVLICQPPAIFSPYARLLVFYFVLFCISPLFQNRYFHILRNTCFKGICVLAVIIAVGSFFCYFLGINLFDRDDELMAQYLQHGGWFAGLTKQSMLLGIVSGLASVYLFAYIMKDRKKWHFVFFFISVGSLIFSASRAALFSVLFALVVMTYLSSMNKSKALKRIVLLILLGGLSYYVFYDYFGGIRYKYEVRDVDVEGGVFESRETKMEHRLTEFVNNPYFGVGFSSVSTRYTSDYSATGTLEPGTSWMTILSMTGLVGFVFVFFVFLDSYRFSKNIDNPVRKLSIQGVLAMFVIHMLVEGYFYAAGSSQFFMVWLTLSLAIDNKYKYFL